MISAVWKDDPDWGLLTNIIFIANSESSSLHKFSRFPALSFCFVQTLVLIATAFLFKILHFALHRVKLFPTPCTARSRGQNHLALPINQNWWNPTWAQADEFHLFSTGFTFNNFHQLNYSLKEKSTSAITYDSFSSTT